MRRYPKGARWYTIVGNDVSGRLKTTSPCDIYGLMFYGVTTVIVQPRGRQKWYRFDLSRGGSARLTETGDDPDPMIMKALLGG